MTKLAKGNKNIETHCTKKKKKKHVKESLTKEHKRQEEKHRTLQQCRTGRRAGKKKMTK